MIDRQRSKSYRWNLIGKLHSLGKVKYARLNGALEINLTNLLAEVDGLLDEPNQAVFDLQQDICALFNLFVYCANSLDD